MLIAEGGRALLCEIGLVIANCTCSSFYANGLAATMIPATLVSYVADKTRHESRNETHLSLLFHSFDAAKACATVVIL